MVLLYSEKGKIGMPIPSFQLTSVDGRRYSLEDFKDRPAVVIMFICNHCPYVQAVEDRILQLVREYTPRGVQFIGICSNDPTDYPDDRPENLRRRWEQKNYGFPYLIDETQEVAKAYGAVCTPEFYLADGERKLVYHGRLDDNWKEPEKVKHRELRDAIEAVLAGGKPSEDQKPSMGCSIKWKKNQG